MVVCSVQEGGVFLGVYVPMKEESIMGNILCSVISEAMPVNNKGFGPFFKKR